MSGLSVQLKPVDTETSRSSRLSLTILTSPINDFLQGYRLQEKRLALFPDRKLPMSGQYVAKIVMNNIIQALEKPENAAMVSIFVPGELLTAAGLTPYSVEALSCFIAGTKCEQAFLRQKMCIRDRIRLCITQRGRERIAYRFSILSGKMI